MIMRYLRNLSALATLIAATVLLTTCAPRLSLLQQARILGTLRVAMVNSATSYYLHGIGAAGFEYDLIREFADAMNLQLEVIEVANHRAAIAAVRSGHAHMAAGLAINPQRRQQVHFTPAYAHVALDVVYHADNRRPDDLAALSEQLALPRFNPLSLRLTQLHPQLEFSQRTDTTPKALLRQVAEGALHSTIANADLVAIMQRRYPDLRVAFTLPQIQHRLAWALPIDNSTGLYNRAVAWLAHAHGNGDIDALHQCYFDPSERMDFVGGQIFAQQIEHRLPEWRSAFQTAAKQYQLDWRLLAAMGYQESHWESDAVSPTGVRGLMMLTQTTADELGLKDRQDPQQSIDGGARYLIQMRQRLPDDISEPDRTWMALAAYNIGFGHLMDARRLLEARGRNPRLWANVRLALTWLTEDRYLDETRFGYAPGLQALAYVDNIRAYYGILNWLTASAPTAHSQPEAGSKAAHATQIAIESPAL